MGFVASRAITSSAQRCNQMAYRFTEDLTAAFVASKGVLLLDEPIMTALLSLDQSLMQPFCLTPLISEILEWRRSYRALSASDRMTEIDSFKEKPSVVIHQNAPSQPRPFIASKPWLPFQPAPPSVLQMDLAAAPPFLPFQKHKRSCRVLLISTWTFHRLPESRSDHYNSKLIVFLWIRCPSFFLQYALPTPGASSRNAQLTSFSWAHRIGGQV